MTRRRRRNPEDYSVQEWSAVGGGHWHTIANYTTLANAKGRARLNAISGIKSRVMGKFSGKVYAQYDPGRSNPRLPARWTPAQVRVNSRGQVQLRLNPRSLVRARRRAGRKANLLRRY